MSGLDGHWFSASLGAKLWELTVSKTDEVADFEVLPARCGGEQDVKKQSKVVGKEIGVGKPQPRGQIQTHICFCIVCGRLRAVPAD